MKEKQKILFYMIVYDLICEAVSLLVLGFDGRFLLGLMIGTGITAVNLAALEKVVDCVIERKHTQSAVLLHLGRFLLFGLAGFCAYLIGITALVAYGTGTTGLAFAAAAYYLRA